MKPNEVQVNWLWVDDGCAQIRCPICGEGIFVSLDESGECCGHKYQLHQENWITEKNENKVKI